MDHMGKPLFRIEITAQRFKIEHIQWGYCNRLTWLRWRLQCRSVEWRRWVRPRSVWSASLELRHKTNILTLNHHIFLKLLLTRSSPQWWSGRSTTPNTMFDFQSPIWGFWGSSKIVLCIDLQNASQCALAGYDIYWQRSPISNRLAEISNDSIAGLLAHYGLSLFVFKWNATIAFSRGNGMG